MSHNPSDRDLMARVGRDQDRSAFEELVRRWDRRVVSFLAKACGDLDAAEDLRQEVFIRVWRYGSGFDPKYAFSTWLFRIASNAMKTWQGKQARRRTIPLDNEDGTPRYEPADSAPDPRQAIATDQSDGRVRALIAGLEAEERELLLMRFDLGLNYREIGAATDTPETTVKSRIYKLLTGLRGQINRAEIGERIS